MKQVLLELRSKEINTSKALMEVWEEVKPELPLSIGIRRVLEEEFDKI